ncbi:MAG: D-alanyl-D-alanine carboxypeptidase family protein [Bacillota bacterium]|nr:D-alanyl-D-alanine carboxypeptidase family protein [Bacillota bacterium]
MKKLIIVLLVLSLFAASGSLAFGTGDELEILASGAILINADTGDILYEKDIHQQLYPASTTKVLTAILALENLELTDNVPIDEEASFTGGSRIYLLEGEEITVEEVLYGMLLESANDAAVALGKMVSGTTEAFTALMNQKAEELGATDSNFVNPNGLHDPEHVSTVYDMAQIARYAMENEEFRRFVSTYQYTVEATNMQDTRYLYNTNRLLYDNQYTVVVNGVTRGCLYEGVTGVKTGWTSQAGGCLVAAAERDGTEFIAVVMGSTDMGRFQDCITLLDYGFENYKTVWGLSQGAGLGTIKIKRGAENRAEVVLGEDVVLNLPLDATEEMLTITTDLEERLKAPVEAGQTAGTVTVSFGGEELGTYDAVLASGVEKGGILSIFGITDATAKKIWTALLLIVLGFFALVVAYVILKRRQIRRRKQRRLERLDRAKARADSAYTARSKTEKTEEDEFWRKYGRGDPH